MTSQSKYLAMPPQTPAILSLIHIDAADDKARVVLVGLRIIYKKKKQKKARCIHVYNKYISNGYSDRHLIDFDNTHALQDEIEGDVLHTQ